MCTQAQAPYIDSVEQDYSHRHRQAYIYNFAVWSPSPRRRQKPRQRRPRPKDTGTMDLHRGSVLVVLLATCTVLTNMRDHRHIHLVSAAAEQFLARVEASGFKAQTHLGSALRRGDLPPPSGCTSAELNAALECQQSINGDPCPCPCPYGGSISVRPSPGCRRVAGRRCFSQGDNAGDEAQDPQGHAKLLGMQAAQDSVHLRHPWDPVVRRLCEPQNPVSRPGVRVERCPRGRKSSVDGQASSRNK